MDDLDHLPDVQTSDDPGVYFLLCANRIKIGASKRVKSSILAVNKSCPYPTRTLLVLPGSDAKADIHARFAHLRKRGEWFDADEPLRRWIVETRKTLEQGRTPHDVRLNVDPRQKFSFDECRQYAASLNVQGQDDWLRLYRKGLLDPRAPADPPSAYLRHWPGWTMFLHRDNTLANNRSSPNETTPHKHVTRIERVLQILAKAGPIRCSLVANSLGAYYTHVYNDLRDLLRQGLVTSETHEGQRLWSLSPAGRDRLPDHEGHLRG